jgi:hypothetical protein
MNLIQIHEAYTILIDILLCAEGRKNIDIGAGTSLWYHQTTPIHIPSQFVPLLYAASNSVQMAVAFLPYYLGQYISDNQSHITDLKKKLWVMPYGSHKKFTPIC